uniref:Uncharacterized protein n=1 Tax=Solanum lycopersicum TaxID=4081 RepID=K4ATB0_SOLLC
MKCLCIGASIKSMSIPIHLIMINLLLCPPELRDRCTVENLDLLSTFEWKAETTFQRCLEMLLVRPLLILASTKILNTFLNIRPFVEPLVTPQTIKFQPIRELSELCAQKGY